MIITSQPTYKQTFEEGSQTLVFNYNVCAGLSGQTVSILAEQTTATSVGDGANQNISVTAVGDLVAYLTGVQAETGNQATVYLTDNSGTFPDYSGLYRILSLSPSGANTRIVCARTDGTPAYQGQKTFTGTQCAVSYRYKHSVRIEYIDRTFFYPSGQSDRVLATFTQQLLIDGSLTVSLGDIAKNYLTEQGSVGLQIRFTEFDFQSTPATPIATATSDIAILVKSSFSQKNYGDLTMFNPENGGRLLPSTGHEIIFGDTKVYPFFINFCLNEIVRSYTKNLIILNFAVFDNDNNRIGSAEQLVLEQVSIGLNSIDISDRLSVVLGKFANAKVGYVTFYLTYSGGGTGEFESGEYNNTQYSVASAYYNSTSAITKINFRYQNLDNTRDFFVYFNHGVGGNITAMFNAYSPETSPEITQTANSKQLSNSVARSFERFAISEKFMPLDKYQQLSGYNLRGSYKEDGIFEAKQVIRLDEFGVRTLWAIEPQQYATSNEQRFVDFSATLVRPNFAFTTIPAPSAVRIVDVAVTSTAAAVNCVIDQRDNQVAFVKAVIFNNQEYISTEAGVSYTVELTGLTPDTTYTARAAIQTVNGSSFSQNFTFKTNA